MCSGTWSNPSWPNIFPRLWYSSGDRPRFGGAWVLFRFAAFAILFASTAGAANPGLIATYSSKDQQITAVSPSPAFILKDNESIHPQLPPQFSAHYTGLIKIIRAGQYKFAADAEIVI